ncbi:MBL fold metallo-hydrolase [Actinoplanes bogorensis]|uniref:MBL fold metallo-hydrolase n=1 Tax=Paractinoplanes bogorensis TaxID=1610840 RepID=A0ABS5YUT7_9ACTN|nr:MBL fold metallo-hydrolase [Actinoplanes bogorensis]MBU2667213.1 MBL fold metallo-hydrolase [Actinoplanes bogorensis]
MNTVVIGDVEITRVQEFAGPSKGTPGFLFPDSTPDYWATLDDPDFFDRTTGTLRTVLHTWLIRSQGRTILLDTGAGNHKERPYASVYAHHDTAYLANLAAAGVAPEDVDLVINTHLHVDHVGWNTRLDGREWVPTFPRATYLMPAADFDYWNPLKNPRPPGDGNQNVFEDSVAPVHAAGQVQLWSGSHRIDSDLVLEAHPGHTPGSSVLRLESGALFVGDMLHSPVQIAQPDVNSCWCEDQAMARAARRRLLAEAADRRLVVFPGHFGGHSACTVAADGDAFVIDSWAALARI